MDSAAFDKAFDILISYRRSNAELVRYVEAVARSIGCSVFRDVREHVGGYEWRRFWASALSKAPDPEFDPGVGPLVAVLVTADVADFRETDEVLREIVDALDNDLKTPVVLLNFDAVANEALIARITQLDANKGALLRKSHQISLRDFPVAAPENAPAELRAGLHDGLLRASRPALRRRLFDKRARAIDWAQGITSNFLSPDVDLSPQIGATTRDASVGSRAFVGNGGLGKSVRLARAVMKTLANPDTLVLPILVAADDVHLGEHVFSQALGFPESGGTSLDAQIGWCEAQLQCRIVFIVDGLERSPQPRTASDVAGLVAPAACLWVSCRPEVWADYFAPALRWEEAAVVRANPMTAGEAAGLLGVASALIAAHPFLAQPVFVDIAKRMQADGALDIERIAAAQRLSETAVLASLREWAVKDAAGDNRHVLRSACIDFLDKLAEAQITSAGFVVKAADLTASEGATELVISRLARERRYLIEHTIEGARAFRLRHDIIDGAAVAQKLAEKAHGFTAVMTAIGTGFGQIVAGQLVQRSKDVGDAATISDFFDTYLLFVDNKDFCGEHGSWNPAAWGAGFVIQQKLGIFSPLIAEVLAAKTAAQAEQTGKPFSRRAKPTRISLGALSSVASTLRGASDTGLIDPGGEIRRALVRHIRSKSVVKKARLIEGLGRLRNKKGLGRKSVQAISRLLPKLKADQAVLSYAADALAHTQDPHALVVLDAIVAGMRAKRARDGTMLGSYAVNLREVIERRNQLAVVMSEQSVAQAPLTLAEVEHALLLYGTEKTSVSDWVVWRRYSAILSQTMVGRAFVDKHPVVIEWLARGRWHDHVQTRRDAMSALGALEHDDAFHALLEASVYERANTVEEAIFGGLRRHAQRLRTVSGGITASRIAQAKERRRAAGADDRSSEFDAAVRSAGGQNGRIVTPGVVEIGPFARVKVAYEPLRASEPEILNVIAAARREADPEFEAKHALERAAISDEALEGTFRLTKWNEAVGFHEGLARLHTPPPQRPRRTLANNAAADENDAEIAQCVRETIHSGRRIVDALGGVSRSPSIVSVHVIVVSSENEVLIARRSVTSHYFPGAWSASLEEQIKSEDLENFAPFTASALRGLAEEFNVEDFSGVEFRGQTLAFERDTEALFPIVVMSAPQKSCEGWIRSVNTDEIEAARLIPLSHLVLEGADAGEWHPTADARWRFAARVLGRCLD